MAKNNNQQQNFSNEDKRSYYANRVNDPNLSEGQRKHAAKRLVSLCGNSGKKSASTGNLPASAGQTNAFNAGIGYGAAKAGKRVPIRDENKQSFRDGVQRGRRLK